MGRDTNQLLLPVSPLFVLLTMLAALSFNMIPLGRVSLLPDFVALVLVFWNVHQSRLVGVGLGFILGLMMDVHDGAVLGQHALAYTLLSFRRLRKFCRCFLQHMPCRWLCALLRVACSQVGKFSWPPCCKPCCGHLSHGCCWLRSAVRLTPIKIDRCDAFIVKRAFK
jgi:rod shape-determining protein MreD